VGGIGMVGFKNQLPPPYKSGSFKIGEWWALKTRSPTKLINQS